MYLVSGERLESLRGLVATIEETPEGITLVIPYNDTEAKAVKLAELRKPIRGERKQ